MILSLILMLNTRKTEWMKISNFKVKIDVTLKSFNKSFFNIVRIPHIYRFI